MMMFIPESTSNQMQKVLISRSSSLSQPEDYSKRPPKAEPFARHLEVTVVIRPGSISDVIGLMKSSGLEQNTRSMKYGVELSGTMKRGPTR